MQTSLSGRQVFLLAISAGVLKWANPGDEAWTTPANDTGEEPAFNITGLVASTSCNQKQFFCDGINYVTFDPIEDSLTIWAATRGTLPEDEDENFCTLICTWRGRIVMSGLFLDPQNLFMSAVGEPLDWDYSGEVAEGETETSVTPTMAVAGNTAPFGLIGDVVTCLIPYTDDILVVGGDSSIRMLRGDPGDGGRVDVISLTIGMAFGLPWCMSPDGTIYFFGSDLQIHSLIPGQSPQPLSARITPELADINTGTHGITMVWDRAKQGLLVFITTLEEPEEDDEHWFWEARTRSWFKVKLGNKDHNPVCCCVLDGNRPEDRVVVIGSWDGYVRSFDLGSVDDDGTAIESEVWLGPFVTADLDEVMIRTVQGVLAQHSGDVTISVHVGKTAEEALEAPASKEWTWGEGRNNNRQVMRAAHAVYLKISSTNQWAMESCRIELEKLGPVRMRGGA